MDNKPRILVVSDDCRLDTGFGRVAANLLDYLYWAGRTPDQDGKYVVAQHGWFFSRLRNAKKPFPVYPTKLTPDGGRLDSDSYGMETIDAVLQSFRPDVVISIGDPWMVIPIAHVRHRYNFRWIGYTPVDSAPHRKALMRMREIDFAQVFDKMDIVLAYGDFGEKGIRQTFPKVKDLRKIPHGVDTSIYRPLDPKQVAIYKHQEMGLPVGSLLMGYFARNQPRKNVPDAIRVLGLLLRDRTFCQDCGGLWEGIHKRCPGNRYVGTPIRKTCDSRFLFHGAPRTNLYLYLHMASEDVGWHIGGLASMFHVAETKHLIQLAAGAGAMGVGVSEPELAMMYNACDFGIYPTHREGFGLGILEHMACGRPVIHPDYSGHTDFAVGPRVALDPLRPFSWDTQSNLADAWTHFAMLVMAADQLVVEDPDEFKRSWGIAEGMEVVTGSALRDQLGRKAWETARTYDWLSGGILPKWETLLDEQIEIHQKKAPWTDLVKV